MTVRAKTIPFRMPSVRSERSRRGIRLPIPTQGPYPKSRSRARIYVKEHLFPNEVIGRVAHGGDLTSALKGRDSSAYGDRLRRLCNPNATVSQPAWIERIGSRGTTRAHSARRWG